MIWYNLLKLSIIVMIIFVVICFILPMTGIAQISVTDVYPVNQSKGISLQPRISATVTHPAGCLMNISFYHGNSSANATHLLGSVTNITNGTYFYGFYPAVNYTTYYWKTAINDGSAWYNETFNFKTGSAGGGHSVYNSLVTAGILFGILGIVRLLMIRR